MRKKGARGMTARKLIQILEALPPNTRIPLEPSVISTLKGKVQNRVKYVSEEEQDRIDAELLRKRSKADRKFVDWETVKRRYGVRSRDDTAAAGRKTQERSAKRPIP
jgi:hypothetical protein